MLVFSALKSSEASWPMGPIESRSLQRRRLNGAVEVLKASETILMLFAIVLPNLLYLLTIRPSWLLNQKPVVYFRFRSFRPLGYSSKNQSPFAVARTFSD